MNMLSNEKVNFKSIEENIFKEMMKLGREIIQEELRMLDKLILDYRDKEIFVPKDFQSTTIKTKLGEIPIVRRRYKMVVNGKSKMIYLLDELLEINDFGLYSQGIVEMVSREITKKSYRETAKTISEDTDNAISHTAVRNIVLKLGKKIKKIEDTIIGTTYKEYEIKKIVINGDGADWTGSIVEGAKEIFQLDMAHIQKKIYMAVSDEEYLKKMQEIVYTKQAKDIFNLIYNYKVELETDNKIMELEKVKELEKYLRNNENGLQRYQYKLGYKEEQLEEMKEELPTLGSEESHMYSVCRDRMKENRTSWSVKGAEALLKVIMNKMNGTIEEIITKKAERKIKEELARRIPEPKVVKKTKENKILYAGRYEIANNFTGSTKKYIIDLLKDKKCSELMLIN